MSFDVVVAAIFALVILGLAVRRAHTAHSVVATNRRAEAEYKALAASIPSARRSPPPFGKTAIRAMPDVRIVEAPQDKERPSG